MSSRIWLAIALLAYLVTPLPADALGSGDLFCRFKVSTAMRKYGSFLTIRASQCQQYRMAGDLPPALDCNAPSTWAANGYAAGAAVWQRDQAKVRGLVNSCQQEAPGGPAALGYSSCPMPCQAITISTTDDLASCIMCVTEDKMLSVKNTVLGMIPLPADRVTAKCQNRIGRDLTAYYNRLMLELTSCQFRKEREQPAYVGVDCSDFLGPSFPTAGKLEKARTKLEGLIASRCGAVDFSDLDTCASDVASEPGCLESQVEQAGATFFPVAWPTVP